MGAFIGSSVGARVKYVDINEMNERAKEKKLREAMQMQPTNQGLGRGQIDTDFEINLALIKALQRKELNLDCIIREFGLWY